MTSHLRLQWVDALRGLAIVLMVAFHFCYDLTYYKLASFDFYNDRFWLNFRTGILGLFLFVTGISLWLANQEKLIWTAISRRFLLILANAFVISLTTWLLFGERYVYFGVLHFIAVASVLGLLFVRFYWLTFVFAIIVLISGQLAFPWFDSGRWRHLAGLMTYKPATEDYVPLLPWFSVVLLGMFFIQSVNKFASLSPSEPIRFLQLLSKPGQHSLVIYMLHQPVLFGLLWIFTSLRS